MSPESNSDRDALRREAERLQAQIDQLQAQIHAISPYNRLATEDEQRQIDELYLQMGRTAAEYSRVWEYGPVRKYQCPCCGMHTLDEQPPGSYDICMVCWWEDDGLQYDQPNYRGGANRESLNEAREAFKRHGISGPPGMGKR